MSESAEYDALSWLYDARATANPAAEPTWRYYRDLCLSDRGPILELGVGTGRVALAVARGGRPVTGIDLSQAMLSICKAEAKSQGLEAMVRLVRGDVRSLPLADEQFSLVIFPFRGVGHLVADADRAALFNEVRRVLLPSGLFVFDHYLFDPAWADAVEGIPQLAGRIDTSAGCARIMDTYQFDRERQRLCCRIKVVAPDGECLDRCELSFSWTQPDQMRSLLEESQLRIEGLFGDYAYNLLDAGAEQQLWHVRK